jgi:hypothetical protein
LAALVAEGEAGVVDAAEVQERSLHVVDVDRVLGDVPGEVVGRPGASLGDWQVLLPERRANSRALGK